MHVSFKHNYSNLFCLNLQLASDDTYSDDTSSMTSTESDKTLKYSFSAKYAPTAGRKKHIKFSPLVQVVLIPCLKEYQDANLLPSMFWTNEEIKGFQLEVFNAFKQYLFFAPAEGNINKRAALKKMLADADYGS